MRIAMDMRYLDRAESGIGSYALNLIKALFEEEKDLELVLIGNSKTGWKCLQHPRAAAGYKRLPLFSWSQGARATLDVYRALL